PDEKLANWLKNLTAKAVDTTDNYEVSAKGFSKSSTDKEPVSLNSVLNGLEDAELYAIYEFPRLYKVHFRAEEGNATKLKNKAYYNFPEKIVYVRQDKDGNTTGRITAPEINIEPESGYELNEDWITENAKNNKKLKPDVETVFIAEDETEIYYYLDFVEPEIKITVRANGGTFKDPSGKDVDNFSFDYARFSPNEDLANWLKNLTATKVDKTDNYEVTTNTWTKVSASGETVTIDEILNYNTSVEIYAKYDFPTLYTYNFTAEKGNSASLINKAYTSFNKVTRHVRLNKENNTKGTLAVPALVPAINGFKSSTTWVDNSGKTLNPNNEVTISKNSDSATTFDYYLTWTEPSINITVYANGGEFEDPDGKKVTDKYSFTYKKFSTAAKIKNWFTGLNPKAVDATDNYEVSASGFAKSKSGTDFVNLDDVVNGSEDIELYAIYEFPVLYKAVFRAEKGGASELKGTAYESFEPETIYVRLNRDKYTKGQLKAPALTSLKLLNDYTTDGIWRAENTAYGNVKAGETLTVEKMSGLDTMYFYLNFTEKVPEPETEPAPAPAPYNPGGGSSGGSSSGGSSREKAGTSTRKAKVQHS
ncbi:MAG: hypothetical protein II411_05645, partial [Lachnospiraceae bacterium]|nr:hypothetical protein [Lachnospiraceae bacterium]